MVGLEDVKITLFERDTNEFIRTIGPEVGNRIIREFKKHRISILRNVDITHTEGDHKLKAIYFKHKGFEKEYFIAPDVCINEGTLKEVDHKYHNTIFFDKPKWKPVVNEFGAFKIDRNLSIMIGFVQRGMFACGQNAQHRSFLGNGTIRTPNTGFNVQSGYIAALLMLHKTIKFEYLPLQRMTIGDKELYYYGERMNHFDDIIIEGDINSDKFICYYLRNDIV